MATKIPGLDWLNRRDEAQLAWATAYLRRRGTRSLFGLLKVTHSDLLAVGRVLESSAQGLVTLNAMKNAWRQKQYRSPQNGKQARTFSLPSASIKALSRLAKSNEQSDTAQLINLIEHANESHRAAQNDVRQQAAKEKTALRDERQKSARYKIQLDVTTEHLERCLNALAKWELSIAEAQPTFNGDEAEAEKLAKNKLDMVRRDIQKATLKQDVATPRAGMTP
jgi:hypothetical protein